MYIVFVTNRPGRVGVNVDVIKYPVFLVGRLPSILTN